MEFSVNHNATFADLAKQEAAMMAKQKLRWC